MGGVQREGDAAAAAEGVWERNPSARQLPVGPFVTAREVFDKGMRLTSAGLVPEASRPRRCSSARSSSTRSFADISRLRLRPPPLPRVPGRCLPENGDGEGENFDVGFEF